MHTTNLRKVGSVMLAVPPAMLELLRLRPRVKVGIAGENGWLVGPDPSDVHDRRATALSWSLRLKHSTR